MTAAELVRIIREEQGGHPGNEYALDEASAVRLLEQDRRDQREWGILQEHQAWTRDLARRIAEALRRYATEPYVVLDETLCKMLATHIARHLKGETDD